MYWRRWKGLFWDAAGDAIGSTDFDHVQKWESYGVPFTEIKLPSISVESY
jgi:hypothetical protein